jgi:LysM repeat protein
MEPTTAPPLEPESAPVAGTAYVVKMHDTIDKIAHKHHTTVAKLKAANGLNGEVLHVGQHLIIPGKTAIASAPAPTMTTTEANGITNLTGSPMTASEETTMTTPAATPAATHPSAGHHTYTVMKGDTLTKIAHKFKITTKALMAANNISDPAKLSVGKKLTIPAHGHAAQATSVAPVPAPAPTETTTVQPTQPAEVKPAPQSSGQLANFVQ